MLILGAKHLVEPTHPCIYRDGVRSHPVWTNLVDFHSKDLSTVDATDAAAMREVRPSQVGKDGRNAEISVACLHRRVVRLLAHHITSILERGVTLALAREVEPHLRLVHDSRDVAAARAAITDHAHSPIQATLVARAHPDHPASVHVGHLAAWVGDGLKALDQQDL
ncbi:hypothetical protein [Variovorax sp. 54]|uniref:hypothetical protein n=1 Tax=Variovorax sp. 54 TaxID=2035212 RepID=UPI0015D4B1BC|nr:hypothetical protein [Variovorax sp. 54]